MDIAMLVEQQARDAIRSLELDPRRDPDALRRFVEQRVADALSAEVALGVEVTGRDDIVRTVLADAPPRSLRCCPWRGR